MRAMTFSLHLLCVVVSTCLSPSVGNELARGFNDDINWVTFEDGLLMAESENKPLMLLIHKSWCGACKALKPQFTTSNALLEESKNFVMVNLQDDEAPTSHEYAPDGGYIPRIFFIKPDGTLMKDIYNKGGNPSYIYYYSTIEAILASMAWTRQHLFGGAETGEL